MRLKLPCLVATFLTLRAATCGDFNGDGFEDLAEGRGADPNRGS